MPAHFRISDFKRRVVGEYLARYFSDCKLGEHYDYETDTQVFRLSKKGDRYVLKIARGYFDEKRAEEIAGQLEMLKVARALNEFRSVLLTNRGLEKST